MKKYILIYGCIAGVILAIALGLLAANMTPTSGHDYMSMVWGYAIMLLAMCFVFVGVRAYRQRELGGHISFGRAFLCGLYISLVACAFYVGAWEVYVRTLASDFMDNYATCQIEELKSDGVTGDSLAKETANIKESAERYKTNMPLRMAYTLGEILPVALLSSLISAAILRKRKPAEPRNLAV